MMPFGGVSSQESEVRIQKTENRRQDTEHRLSVICLFIIGFLVGCAPKAALIDNGVQFPEQGKVDIERIDVEGITDEDVVTIKASKALSYTAFKLVDPLRLIIDIPDVDPERYKKEPIQVEDGIINKINTDLYEEKSGAIGRIEIEMEAGVGYELEPGGDTLIVRFKKDNGGEELKVGDVNTGKTELAPPILDRAENEKKALNMVEAEKIEDDSQEILSSPVKVVVVSEAIKETSSKKGLIDKKDAERLLSIDIDQWDDGYIDAVLRGDGAITGNYDIFGLDDPARIVIDLWGIENVIGEDVLFVDNPYIEMVRIGSHPDKTRVVFDMREGSPLLYSVDKREDSLLIAFRGEGGQSGEKGADVLHSLPQEQVQAVEKDQSIEVKGVDFEDTALASRVIVTSSDEVDYDVASSFDGKTVALILKGVFLPEHLQRTLDTSELDSPIALVSSYNSGLESENRAMIVVRLKDKGTHEVAQKGNLLSLDFPKVGVKEGVERRGETPELPLVEASDAEVVKEVVEPLVEEGIHTAKEVKVSTEPEKIAFAPEVLNPVEKVVEAAEAVKVSTEPEKKVVAAREPEPVEGKVVEGEEIKEVVELPIVDKKVEVPVKTEKQVKVLSPEPKRIQEVDLAPGHVKVTKAPKEKESKPDKKVKKKASKTKTIVFKKKVVDKIAIEKPDKTKKVVTPEMVAAEKQYTGRRISLDFKDADIKNILRLIAEVSKLNIVAGDDVKGRVSLRLVNVPWDQVLEIVLKTNDLGMIREGNVLRIAPLQKIAKEKDRLVAEKKAEEKLEDLIVRLVPVNYALAGDLQDKVTPLLGERGSVSVDSRTNTLIIKDIESNVEEAQALVKKLDSPTPQVLIEARIVEANSNFARDLGVEWGADISDASPDKAMDIFGNLSTSGLTPPSGAAGTSNFAVSLPASGTAGTLGAIGFSFGKLTGTTFTLDLRLSAGETKGLTKIISRPRIVTLDNKEAKIEQGESIPFETTSDGGTSTEFVDANLSLKVTPHITPDNSIIMKIKASNNEIGSFRTSSGAPSISKKEASTEVLVHNGETIVIGGIMKTKKTDSGSGVPYFKDIPILGWLFKRHSVLDTQDELLIFITPTIVERE